MHYHTSNRSSLKKKNQMKKKYSLALHIFRRDLRLHDNTALIEALNLSKEVIPCFIFDKRQIENNRYKSDHCIQFMMNSLQNLDDAFQQKQSRLYYFYGIAEDIVAELLHQLPIQAVFVNRDYTPFSLHRDNAIEKHCRAQSLAFRTYADALLHEPEETLKSSHEPYTIFTPFFKRASLLSVATPQKNLHQHYYREKISLENKKIIASLLQKNHAQLAIKGGRDEGLFLLKQIKTLADYQTVHDFPAIHGTSLLSAHHKFGTVSIRETYAVINQLFGKTHPLIRQLYWRDFFTHILFHFPSVLGHAFHAKYANIKWNNNQTYFQAWCSGQTGFPIIDAGMRELNSTGYMHNRVRMIVASFLTKDLHIDWRWGERYFAQKLIDYDPALNNGNWQWAASTGCDAQPYFRIFNPWLQQKKFDPNCVYIKRWLPELAHIDAEVIHTLYRHTGKLTNYSSPLVDHAIESQKAKHMYKTLN